MWKINLNLSKESLDEATKELTLITSKLEEANKICIDMMVEWGVERAKQVLESKIGLTSYIPTGTLTNSISGDSMMENINTAVGRIYTEINYAAYVEYGTGIRGSSTNEATMADLNNEIVNLVYNEKWKGQTAKNFMWETREELIRLYPTFMKEAISKVGG